MLLVVGATGNIGRHLVPLLVREGRKVRVLTRDASRASLWDDEVRSSLDVVEGHIEDPAVLATALDGVERAFVTLPGTPAQVAQETGLLRAAARAGVGHVVKVSVIGPATDHPVAYARYQAQIESVLSSTGIATTILRPNWFAENFVGSAATITGDGAVYGSAGAGRVAFVDSRDTAGVAAHVLTGSGHEGREYVVTGPQALTFAEAAQELAQGLGRPVEYVDLDDESFAGALAGAGLPADVVEAVVSIMGNARRGALAEVTTTVPELLGRPARSLRQWAADNAVAFA